MTYGRVNYTTRLGKLSSAYLEPLTGDAWDVYSREPVLLVQDLDKSYRETVPLPAISHIANQSNNVILKPQVSLLMLIPVIFFGLGMLWLSLTFL